MNNKIVDLIKTANTISIYTHINTDCDAVGSSLALRESLLQLGKKVDVFVNSEFPNNFKFYGDLSFYNKKNFSNYDLAICLDCATEARLGKYRYTYRKGIKNTLAIDHHDLINERFCKVNYIRHSSSTCEILFGILQDLDIRFTPFICKCLISGIITDTGRLTYSATNKTFKVLGKLLDLGNLTIEEITEPLLKSMKMETFDMLKKAYQNIEFYSEGKIGLLIFSYADFKETGASMDDMNIFSEIPMQLETVKFSILASEDDKGYFRVSFRSKGNISAKDVAESFGGGGHANASGCKIFGSFDEVKQKLIDNTIQTLGWTKFIT